MENSTSGIFYFWIVEQWKRRIIYLEKSVIGGMESWRLGDLEKRRQVNTVKCEDLSHFQCAGIAFFQILNVYRIGGSHSFCKFGGIFVLYEDFERNIS